MLARVGLGTLTLALLAWGSPSRFCFAEVPDPQEYRRLTDQVWKAFLTHDAELFYSLYEVSDKVKGPMINERNLNQIRILVKGEILEVLVEKIPPKDMQEIQDIQNRGVDPLRYSVNPERMLLLRFRGEQSGRNLLIGKKDGQWRIATFTGHAT